MAPLGDSPANIVAKKRVFKNAGVFSPKLIENGVRRLYASAPDDSVIR
jgi:hypothetical protein